MNEAILQDLQNLPLIQVMKKHNLAEKTLKKIAKSHGIRYKTAPKNSRLRAQIIETLQNQEASVVELAHRFNVEPQYIRDILHKLGKKTAIKEIRYRITPELEQRLLSYAGQDISLKEICKRENIDFKVIKNWEQRTGHKLPRINLFKNFKSRVEELLDNISLVEYKSCGDHVYKCSKGHVFSKHKSNIWKRPYCPVCKPVSLEEISFRENLPDIHFERNVRYPLDNELEIDYYDPIKKIGIEYHGLYWHSEAKIPSTYHQKKALKALSKGITLFQFFANEVKEKPQIVKSMINAKYGIFKKKIPARQCELKEIPNEDYKTFCENNHLKGFAPAKFKFGLYFNGQLVFALSLRKHKEGLEIARLVSQRDTIVFGGFSKVLKYLKRRFPNSKIITYADLRYSNGSSYEKVGFTKIGITRPDWAWYRGEKLFNRRISWGKKDNDLRNLGFLKVYGAGNLKYEMEL